MTQTIHEYYNKVFSNLYNRLYDAYDLIDDIIYDIQDERIYLELLLKEPIMDKKIKAVKKTVDKKMNGLLKADKKMDKSCAKAKMMAKKKK